MPHVAMLATAVVAVVALIVVLTRPDGGSGAGGGELFLQAAGETGPDPFTESTANDSSTPPVTPSPATETAPQNAVRGVNGGAPGLYGGTRNTASCDVEKQISYLKAVPEKNRAFASVAGVDPSGVPAHLRSLTPMQLRMDTRVTNHGYRDGAATPYQAVLQAGTAVLVDEHGVPRVRCACGNPLTPPVAQRTTPRLTGDSWPSYSPSNTVVVTPAPKVIKIFVLYDPDRDDWFHRQPGDTGDKDRETEPPRQPTPKPTTTAPPARDDKSPSPEDGTKEKDKPEEKDKDKPEDRDKREEPSPGENGTTQEPSPEENGTTQEPSPEGPAPEENSEQPAPEENGTPEAPTPESPAPPSPEYEAPPQSAPLGGVPATAAPGL